MKTFRVKISERHGAFSHEAYFTSLPTTEDVVASIKRDMEIAGGDYSAFYNKCLRSAEEFAWPETWGNRTSETGKMANDDFCIRIKRASVIDNGQGD